MKMKGLAAVVAGAAFVVVTAALVGSCASLKLVSQRPASGAAVDATSAATDSDDATSAGDQGKATKAAPAANGVDADSSATSD